VRDHRSSRVHGRRGHRSTFAGLRLAAFARSQPFAHYVACLPSRAEEPAIHVFQRFVLREAPSREAARIEIARDGLNPHSC